jgi:cyclophilin family peptidyl-prolyl cis-trans isomerase
MLQEHDLGVPMIDEKVSTTANSFIAYTKRGYYKEHIFPTIRDSSLSLLLM